MWSKNSAQLEYIRNNVHWILLNMVDKMWKQIEKQLNYNFINRNIVNFLERLRLLYIYIAAAC